MANPVEKSGSSTKSTWFIPSSFRPASIQVRTYGGSLDGSWMEAGENESHRLCTKPGFFYGGSPNIILIASKLNNNNTVIILYVRRATTWRRWSYLRLHQYLLNTNNKYTVVILIQNPTNRVSLILFYWDDFKLYSTLCIRCYFHHSCCCTLLSSIIRWVNLYGL